MSAKVLAAKILFIGLLAPAAWPNPASGSTAKDLAQLSNNGSRLVFHEMAYSARIMNDEARFGVEATVESTGNQGAGEVMFEGDLAVLPPKLPSALRLERTGNEYRL